MCLLSFDCQTKSILCKINTNAEACKRGRGWVSGGGIFSQETISDK